MKQFIKWQDIILKKSSGQEKTTCPACSHTRKNKTDRCLSVNIGKGVANCKHCEAVSVRDKPSVEYKLPIQNWSNYTAISDTMVKYFESRKISQSTIKALGITEEEYFQPAINSKCQNIVFNSFEGETLVNKKYRSGGKKFTQSAGTKSIFYNVNSAIGQKELYITEGEFDVLALYEIGIKNVVSVPNGANDNDDYWKHSEKYIKDVDRFIIAVDNDEKGNELKEKIAQRLGRYRCSFIEWHGKDANDDLISGHIKESINNVKHFPVTGTSTIEDLYNGVIDLYDNGLPDTIFPKNERFGYLKDIFSVMRGQLTTVTGIPSHGKSNFVDDYVLELVDDYKMKASWFSPEHSPMELYKTNLISKVIGKNFWKDTDNAKRVSKEEINQYREWSKEKIYLTHCDNGNLPTWDWLLEKFQEQMYSFGIDIFVIDAFNKVLLPKGNKLEQINIVLTKLTHFAQSNNVLIFLVAHPTKMQKDESGAYGVPTLYDVSGSADFRNQTHNGFTVHRNFGSDTEEPYTEFFNMKTKFNFQGNIGESIKLKYCIDNGRYYVGENKPMYNLITKEKSCTLPKIEPKDAFNDKVPF
jgi:twinkle protein